MTFSPFFILLYFLQPRTEFYIILKLIFDQFLGVADFCTSPSIRLPDHIETDTHTTVILGNITDGRDSGIAA